VEKFIANIRVDKCAVLKVIEANLKVICCLIGNRCSPIRVGVIWSHFLLCTATRASAFCTRWCQNNQLFWISMCLSGGLLVTLPAHADPDLKSTDWRAVMAHWRWHG